MIHYLLALNVPDTGIPNTSTGLSTVNQTVPLVGNAQTITNNDTIKNLLNIGTNALNIILYVAGAVLVISVIFHSITLITSSGNDEALGKAKKGLTNAAVGIIIVALVFVITNAIIQFALLK